MAGIDQDLAPDEVSRAISGAEVTKPGSHAQATLISAQVIPSADEDFETHIEAAVNSIHGAQFTKIGVWDQNSEALLSVFPVSLGVLYRFRHISGPRTRVRLTG